ncbi:methyl-accepting chemotaxis sensory transducer [Candidatus Moduliflexus flocculans]|uniref:Methyl-accepting chemotaxis sensory transducer n=1 Tax=Candidatus Moduliflexus flocculans TaxID=1499966 RepID=A0A0S6W5B5_9BACT|nr:methyl-accepting chemotaxis sensory transducer [Candidatus Moduliflexus flocculans]
MSQRRSFVRWGITTKFLAFDCLVILALGAIVAVVFISFQKMDALTTTILDQNLARIIKNSESSQELTTLFAELVTVIFSDQSEAGAARLQALQEQLRSLTSQEANAELQTLIQQFTQQLSAVLEQAALIKQRSAEFTGIEDDFIFNVEMLEDILSEKIETDNAGNVLYLNQLKQLQAMSAGYRSTFLQIVKAVNELQKTGAQNLEEPAKEPAVFNTINSLLSRFGTVTSNKDTEIAKQGEQLVAIITRYKEEIGQYQTAQRTFSEQLALAGQTKEQALNALRSRNQENVLAAETIRSDIHVRVQTSRQFVMLLSAAIGVILLLLSYGAIKTVRPLIALSHAAQQIANGEMDIHLPFVRSADEIGVLTGAFASMAQHLSGTVRDVKAAAQQVALKSREMTIVAEQMSEGASEQAAASQEVSSSMEEMAANIRQNADNAKAAEAMAAQSAHDALEGSQAVNEIITAMQMIVDEISSIQEIANQTNILSMNATIEAARAQEYGKGFAVVASSVRELAKLSRNAADKIQRLVKDCMIRSEQAGACLNRLTPNSQKTAEFVKEIAASSQKQTTGAEHINLAIQQLDSVTQQNASTAEEVSATIETLTAQAIHLQEAMAFFTVKEEEPTKDKTEEGDLLQRINELEQQLNELRAYAQPQSQVTSANAPAQLKKSQISGLFHLTGNHVAGDERDQEFERF